MQEKDEEKDGEKDGGGRTKIIHSEAVTSETISLLVENILFSSFPPFKSSSESSFKSSSVVNTKSKENSFRWGMIPEHTLEEGRWRSQVNPEAEHPHQFDLLLLLFPNHL